jgi:hypothetical protein
MKHCRVLSLLAMFALGASASSALAQHGGKAEPNRIEFKRGSGSTTISGMVRGSEQAEYLFAAKKGQHLIVRVSSTPRRTCLIELHGPDNIDLAFSQYGFEGVLPATGDYFLIVLRPTESKGRSRYKLTVTVSPARENGKAALEREEYAVYSAMIRELHARDGRRLIVIADPTCCGDPATAKGYSRYPYQQSAPISEEIFEDFRQRNAERVPLKRRFNLPTEYVIVELVEIIKLLPKPPDDFKKFYAKYPGSRGFITLSKVGFNAKRDAAFLYSNMVCGVRCQEGKFFVLAKKSGVWKITNSVLHTVYEP